MSIQYFQKERGGVSPVGYEVPHIYKDPPKAIFTRKYEPVNVADVMYMVQTDNPRGDPTRINDNLQYFARGVNPMVEIDYGGHGAASQNQSIHQNQAGSQFKVEVVRPPEYPVETLVALSRPRIHQNYSATTNKSNMNAINGGDSYDKNKVRNMTRPDVISGVVKSNPTLSQMLEFGPIVDQYSVKNKIVADKESGVLYTTPSMQYIGNGEEALRPRNVDQNKIKDTLLKELNTNFSTISIYDPKTNNKIDKQTLKILPRTKISIYKFVNQNTYFCRFFVGRKYFKSGRFEKTCKTRNINEAIVKANQYYKDWFIQHATDTIEKERDFDLDIAQPFINFRIRKYQNKTHLKNNEQGERDKSKYNYLKPFFENVDYKDLDLVEDVINNDVLSKLKDDDKSGSTINKYLSLITQMFKRALTRGIVNYVPDTPTQQVINTPRYPYENSDLNLINGRCREEYKKTNDIFFLESKDYFNLLRSAGFRPGLEPLSLKRKDFEFISSPNNPDEKFLKFTIWGTKTKPIHNPIANPYFSEKVFPEILNRHSNLSDNDYLLFPFQKDRTRLKQSTGKLFVRFSKDLNLYFHKGGTRPLYSIRHTYATELYKKGTSIDDIAQLMNTSARMIIGVYLGHTNQALINLIKRVPTNLKIIK